jgi:serine/threonine-protein kinase
VPELVGVERTIASARLQDVGLRAGAISERADSSIDKGLVIESIPAAKSLIPVGSAVDLVVSSGPAEPEPVVVPNVIGQSPEDAQAALAKAGLRGVRGADRASSEVKAGMVAETDPGAGAIVRADSTVTFLVSSGPAEPEPVVVPNVIGQSAAKAEVALSKAGLRVIRVPNRSIEGVKEGLVAETSPEAGARVPPGSPVKVLVSSGPPQPASTSPSSSSEPPPVIN